jgi:hypothetical protein
MDPLQASEYLKNIATSAAIIIGGIWTFWRFVLNGEGKPKIQFDIDLRIVGRQGSKILIEAIAIVHNTGKVRHWIRKFFLDILILQEIDPIERGNEHINYQVAFKKFNPEKSVIDEKDAKDRIVWVPKSWYDTFIDADVAQRYTYLSYVPEDTAFISLYSRFYFKPFLSFRKSFQSVQKTFNVREIESSNNKERWNKVT